MGNLRWDKLSKNENQQNFPEKKLVSNQLDNTKCYLIRGGAYNIFLNILMNFIPQ